MGKGANENGREGLLVCDETASAEVLPLTVCTMFGGSTYKTPRSLLLSGNDPVTRLSRGR